MSDKTTMCRVCHDEFNPNELISPCICRGSGEFVCIHCLPKILIYFRACSICNTRCGNYVDGKYLKNTKPPVSISNNRFYSLEFRRCFRDFRDSFIAIMIVILCILFAKYTYFFIGSIPKCDENGNCVSLLDHMGVNMTNVKEGKIYSYTQGVDNILMKLYHFPYFIIEEEEITYPPFLSPEPLFPDQFNPYYKDFSKTYTELRTKVLNILINSTTTTTTNTDNGKMWSPFNYIMDLMTWLNYLKYP